MAWFAPLPFLEKVFFYIAAPSTLILLIQTLFLFVGGDSDDVSDSDSDFDADTGIEPEDMGGDETEYLSKTGHSLRFFTTRGILAFLTLSGWTGICVLELGGSNILAILLAFQIGLVAMIGIAFLVAAMMRLQSSGTIEYSMAIGLMGNTYLPIPAAAAGVGKVSLTLGGSLKEYDAMTFDDCAIPTGEPVQVIDITQGHIMVVQRETLAESYTITE